MARDSLGRYTRRPRLVGSGRRLRMVGTEGGTEVDGVVTGPPVILTGGRLYAAPPDPKPEPKASKGDRKAGS